MAVVHWLRQRITPILTVLLAVAITVVLFVLRDRVSALGDYGYLGAFLVGLISCATIILPVPGIVVLFALGADPNLNPILVGFIGATGGVLGEMTGFIAGYGGRRMIKKKGRLYTLVENWMKRWGGWAIFVFAAAPLPLFDIAGLVAGAIGYPAWKFLLIAWPGKSIKYILLVLAGAWGWETVLGWFG
ncbi:MAG: VTT domain-containing protein [Dehalococcoidia bacterium]|jgi:membrane protein YqaA with SNARE-associated domain